MAFYHEHLKRMAERGKLLLAGEALDSEGESAPIDPTVAARIANVLLHMHMKGNVDGPAPSESGKLTNMLLDSLHCPVGPCLLRWFNFISFQNSTEYRLVLMFSYKWQNS